MWEYLSDCPEPRPELMFRQAQHEQGQYEQAVPQFLGTPNVIQLGEQVSFSVLNGIYWKEQQQT